MPTIVHPSQQSSSVLQDVTNTSIRIGQHSPSTDPKASSPNKAALFSHDFKESYDDDESIASSGSYLSRDCNLPPPLPSLAPSGSDNVSATELDEPVQYSVVNESGANLLAGIKQKVIIAQQGHGPKISRLWKQDDVKIKKSWRNRARNTDWKSAKCIIKNFRPFPSKQYGKARPPLLIHSDYTNPYHKAHAVNAWNHMSPGQQGLLKQYCTGLAVTE